jgi:para-nitrobenzyl esterase
MILLWRRSLHRERLRENGEVAAMTKLTIPLGELEGVQNNAHQAWLGIPFAQPPVGDFRFCPPRPVEPWTGTRLATDYGNSCPQGTHVIPGMAASGSRDEDCLYLNVYTPKADSARRPVLFWIHGGGYYLKYYRSDLTILPQSKPCR